MAQSDSSAAELVRWPAKNLHRLPNSVDLALAALIEPLSCAIHAFDLLPRGSSALLDLRRRHHGFDHGSARTARGAASVSVVDQAQRQQAARDVGIDLVGSSPDELARSGGWDTVIDCTGAVAAVGDGLNRVRRGGTFQQFGVAPSDAQAKFSPFRMYNDELTVVGSMAVLHSYARAVDMFVAGALNAKAMVSHAFALADCGNAIRLFVPAPGGRSRSRPRARESTELL